MSVNISFAVLFDKIQSLASASRNVTTNSFDVLEREIGASVKHLHVEHVGAEYDSYNYMAVKGMKDITETRSCSLFDSDCDGIAFEMQGGKDALFMVELKSRFCTQNLNNALKQMTFSFLKMHSMLSLCEDYDVDNVSLHFIAACQCFENENQKIGVYNLISKAESISAHSLEGLFLRKLIEHRDMDVRFGDIASLWHLPLHDKLMNKDMVLSLQMTTQFGDSSLVYSY